MIGHAPIVVVVFMGLLALLAIAVLIAAWAAGNRAAEAQDRAEEAARIIIEEGDAL